jgi:hypothetical protein
MMKSTIRTIAAMLGAAAWLAAQAAGTVGDVLPPGFPVIVDTSLGKPVIFTARQQRHAIPDRLQPLRPHTGHGAIPGRQRLFDQ